MFNIKKIYIVVLDSVYTLFLYALIHTEKLDNTFFFFSDGIKIDIRQNLNHMYIKKRDNIENKLINFIYMLVFNTRLWLKLIFLRGKVEKVYGQDHIPLARYFLHRFPFYLLEDGLANYSVKKQVSLSDNYFAKLIRGLFKMRKFNVFGLDDQVKKIYLTGIAPVPECIQHKVELISISNLWNEKNINEKEKIMSIFNIELTLINEIKQYPYLLLTQPLSEDGIISEEEKIELYKKITNDIPKEKLVIKTHPRETTNYQTIFNESMVLATPFPSQLFILNDIKFSTVITLFSTGIMDFISDETHVQFYGTSCHPILLNKFGLFLWDKDEKKILRE